MNASLMADLLSQKRICLNGTYADRATGERVVVELIGAGPSGRTCYVSYKSESREIGCLSVHYFNKRFEFQNSECEFPRR